MVSSTLLTLGKDLQRAASRRGYAEVQRLAASVATAAAAEARASADSTEIATWLQDLYTRTEILLRIARATQADELRQVTLLKRYLLNAAIGH
jgi:hypothetical protein